MKRRNLLLGLAATTAAGAFLLRPADRGTPHDGWFRTLNDMLRAQGPGHPVLVIDLDRYERNCARLRRATGEQGKTLRLVAKSLPSVPLLRHAMAHTGAQRLMSFHQPFLNALARELPGSDLLLGKPMPVRAAETFYRKLDAGAGFDPARQLQWLVDSGARLDQYLQLARSLGTSLRVNIEIDVGLHRGGLATPEQLDPLLRTIGDHPRHLSLAGFMGYDAHVGKIPSVLESRASSYHKATTAYRAFIARLQATQPAVDPASLVFNGAGSPTFRLHGKDSPLTEVAVGSALLKPGDFELDLLADFEPAAFIATPVLKAMDGLHLPGVAALGDAWALWDSNRRRTFFVYGGKWLAHPASPAGITDNSLYGSSSNQSILNGSAATGLAVDDYVFLRPTQSEAVLLQFGDLALVRNGRIESWAPVLAPDHETT